MRSQLELEPTFAAGRWGYPYTAHPYGYPYGYDRDDLVYDDLEGNRLDAHGFRGLHEVTGEVTALDRNRGRVTLKTFEGTLDLHFPTAALRDVQKGDRLTVSLGLKEAGGPSASPRTENRGSR